MTTNEILAGAGRFGDVDIILATHCHKDHCSEADLLRYKKPDVLIIVPSDSFQGFNDRPVQKTIYLSESGIAWEDDHLRITAVKTLHDGCSFAVERMHFTYIIQTKSDNSALLIMGDAMTEPGMFAEWLSGTKLRAVTVNFVEMNQEKGRAFLKDLSPEHILLCHLPLPEDDKNHMGKLSIRNTAKYRDQMPEITTCYEPGTILEI